MKGQKIGSPSWSQDGERLAWIWGSGLNVGWRMAVGITDLVTGKGTILHPYEPIGRGGWPPAAAWSPDGTRFWVDVWALNQAEGGFWTVLPGEAQIEELQFAYASHAAWSPDGRVIALVETPAEGSVLVRVFKAGSWEWVMEQELPFGSWVLRWDNID